MSHWTDFAGPIFVGVAAAAVWIWRRRRDAPPLGIVLLLKAPRPLNAEILAFAFSKVTGRGFHAPTPEEADECPGPEDLPAGDAVIGHSPSFLAKSGETLFLINSVPAPYFPPSTSFANHRAWLSAEILHPESETPENYRIVGRVLAELIGPDCVALYHPESKRVVPANLERTTELLRSEDPIAATFR